MNLDTTLTGVARDAPWNREEALASAQLASLWEAPVGIAFLDEGLRFVRVNKTLATMNGFPPEAHIGRSIQELLPTSSPKVVEALEHVLSTGQPLVNALITGRTPAHPEEDHHYLANYYPVKNGAGDVIGLGATVHDITQWRCAEMARDASEARFRSLVLATAQVVWTTDADGEMVEDNPTWRAFTGQTSQQLLKHGWLDAVHPEDRTRVLRAWKEAVVGRRPYEAEYRLRRPNGSYTSTLARGAPVFNDDSSLREWVGTNTDISASKHAQEEREQLLYKLQHALRARDEFLTLAAHELRTPLTTLGLRLQSLGRETQGWPGSQPAHRVLQLMETMRRQVKRLTDLVNSLVDVTHLEKDPLPLELETLELCALTHEVAARLADEAARAGCVLEVEADCPVWGTWDRLRLEQVLVHLLSNALKYGAGRPVRIRVTEAEGRARLQVRDEGIGISPEHLPRIFGRFERAVSERHYGGLGLGLYVTQRFVEALGGKVTAGSMPGAGATFTVELPLRTPPS